MKSKNVKVIACIISLVSIMSLTGISAYLTDMEVANNVFTIGEVKIHIDEPNWRELAKVNEDGNYEYEESIKPNSVIIKDPKIINDGDNSAYVYLKVKVPVANVVVAEEDGTIKNPIPKDTELFEYTPNSDWKEIESARVTTETTTEKLEYNTYVYYYNDILKKKGEEGDTTQTLFDEVKFVNVTEKPTGLEKCQIGIEAYAIQTENLPENTTIESAYQIYLNQSSSEINP